MRSCENFALAMAKDYEIKVLTSSRDLGDQEILPGIVQNEWQEFEQGIHVKYLSLDSVSLLAWKKELASFPEAFVYLNSMFSLPFTILPLTALLLKGTYTKVILAPRGMLKASALAFKPLKKKLFLNAFKWSGLARRIHYHATDEQEAKDIAKHLSVPTPKISVLPNSLPARQDARISISKQPGKVSLLFLARIHPVKNLAFLLKVLNTLPVNDLNITLTICGPVEDSLYTESCKKIAETTPSNVQITWLSEQPHDRVGDIFRQHHFLALPTQGENFGHSIFESFLHGRPVIISDQTPWLKLRKKSLGWALPLTSVEAWHEALLEAIQMDQSTFDKWSGAAWQFAHEYMSSTKMIQGYKALFSTEKSPI